MKLVTFDAGRVGRLEGEGGDGVVVELECASTREWFERGGQARETGERLPLAQVRLRAPIVPKKFFHTAGNFADHHEELQAVAGRNETGIPLRQDALDPGFHRVPPGPARTDRDAGGGAVT